MRKESTLFYFNRVAWSLLSTTIILADYLNTFNKNLLPIGFWTNHVGSVPGAAAAGIGFSLSEFLSDGLSSRNAILLKTILPALLFFGVEAAEILGIGNTPDLLDNPAEMIAFLGTACLFELIYPPMRKYLSNPSIV